MIPPGTIRVDATERTSVTLDCTHDDGGSHDPTWSRDSVEIHRQKGFDVSPVDRTLTLTDVKLRDSGLYYCGRKAVFLKVIEGESQRGTQKYGWNDQGSTHPNHTDINTRTFKNTKTTIRSSNTSIFNIPSNYYD
ncbi:hypothetical protein NQZ68_031122 [Dissostichus eleginoides]|nr:hypothetical protein NQZ68_031122 [Dissostichus eleginoides]